MYNGYVVVLIFHLLSLFVSRFFSPPLSLFMSFEIIVIWFIFHALEIRVLWLNIKPTEPGIQTFQ